MTAPAPHRASPIGVIAGLLIIGSIVAAGSFWLRQYVSDRGEIWIINGGNRSAVVHVDDRPHTLTSNEILAATQPRAPSLDLRMNTSERVTTVTVTRTPGRQEVLLIDLDPEAIYVNIDVTPRFAARGSPPAKELNEDGRSFRPKVIEVRGPGQILRMRGGEAATIGPLEGLPGAVYLARRYGRSVHKIMRVIPPVDTASLAAAVEKQLAAEGPLVELEAVLRTPVE